MPPRFQCLRPVQNVFTKPYYYRSSFSTKTRSMADFLSSSSALSNIDRPSSLHPARAAGLEIPKNVLPEGKAKEAPLGIDEHRKKAAEKDALARRTSVEELKARREAEALTRQIRRRWRAGEVYAPHDLSPQEMKKWKSRKTPDYDVFDILNMNPIDEYKNFSIMSEFMTPMGRIKHSKETGLRPVNQRKIAKAIRRSIGLGIMPSVHRHPEILMKENNRRNKEQMNVAKMPSPY